MESWCDSRCETRGEPACDTQNNTHGGLHHSMLSIGHSTMNNGLKEHLQHAMGRLTDETREMLVRPMETHCGTHCKTRSDPSYDTRSDTRDHLPSSKLVKPGKTIVKPIRKPIVKPIVKPVGKPVVKPMVTLVVKPRVIPVTVFFLPSL